MSGRFTQVGKGRATGHVCGLGRPRRSRRRCRPPRRRVRKVVSATSCVTMWDWADPKAYLHDEIATDKRNPTVNANGPVYGAPEETADYFSVVLPKNNAAEQVPLPVRDPEMPRPGRPPPRVAVLG